MSSARKASPARLARAPALVVARLRRACLSFPEALEKPSHGEPTWFAGRGKVFATLDDHHHRAQHLSVWLPLPLGAQEALVAEDPARFFRPPYVGGAGWVGVVLDGRPDWHRVERLLREAYLHVALPRLRALVAGAPGQRASAAGARALADLDGIGPAMLEDFRRLGVPDVAALARRDGQDLYDRLCAISGVRQDPCVLDTLRCAVAQARDPDLPPEQRRWWWWSRRRLAEGVTDPAGPPGPGTLEATCAATSASSTTSIPPRRRRRSRPRRSSSSAR